MPPSKNISFDELSKYFHLPINQVARELGVCATILKKICRRNGIPRWPHRKIKSLDKMISNLNMNLAKNPQERHEIDREIDSLTSKKQEIMKNPDILAKSSSGEFCIRPVPLGVSSQRMKHSKLPHRASFTPNAFKVRELQSEDNEVPISCFDPQYIPATSLLSSSGSQLIHSAPPNYVDMVFNEAAKVAVPFPSASPALPRTLSSGSALPASPVKALVNTSSSEFHLPPPSNAPPTSLHSLAEASVPQPHAQRALSSAHYQSPSLPFVSLNMSTPPPGFNFTIPSMENPIVQHPTTLPAFKYNDSASKKMLPTLEPLLTPPTPLQSGSTSTSTANGGSAFPEWFFDERARITQSTATPQLLPKFNM